MNVKFPKAQYSVLFDKTAKTVTINGVGGINSLVVHSIKNITANKLIYAIGDPLLKGTIVRSLSADTLVITLAFDTSAMNNSDYIDVSCAADGEELIFDSLVSAGQASSIVAFGRMRGIVADTFTRPADTNAYAIGDAIQNATSAPAARKLTSLFPSGGGSGYLSLWLWCGNNVVTPKIRVHLFNALPSTRVNDNAAFSVASGDADKYLGYIDLEALNTGVAMGSSRKEIITSGTDVWFELQTLDAFTPASGTAYRLSSIVDSNV